MVDETKPSIDKRLVKVGNSLYVALPNEVMEQWNLGKGDEVRLHIGDGVVKIEPKQASVVTTLSAEGIDALARAMNDIQVTVNLDPEGRSINLQFSGQNTELVEALTHNLWRLLPGLLGLLGVRITPGISGRGETAS